MIYYKAEFFSEKEISAVTKWLAHEGYALAVTAVEGKIASLEAEHLQRHRDSDCGRIQSEILDAQRSLDAAAPYYHFLKVLKELNNQKERLARATFTTEPQPKPSRAI